MAVFIPSMDHDMIPVTLNASNEVVIAQERSSSPPNVKEQEKRVRREIANSNERRRMQSINAGFQSLRNLLPIPDGEKLSKAAILQQTTNLIYRLEKEKTNLLNQIASLKRMIRKGEMDPDSPGVQKRKRSDSMMDEGIGSPEGMEESSMEEMQKSILELRSQLDRERQYRKALEDKNRVLEAKFYPEKIKQLTRQIQVKDEAAAVDDSQCTREHRLEEIKERERLQLEEQTLAAAAVALENYPVGMGTFTSLYVQIPGLYGDDGILPARLALKTDGHTPLKKFQERPTVLWFLQNYGIPASEGMELVCIVGIVASLVCLVSQRMRDCMTFALLWFLYLSVYQVGQTFLWFQWDILLLEAGFLTILVAPLQLLKWKQPVERQHDTITFWLVRWLLFRLMFASGVVKLTSQCPTWWGLTALNYHYESQCISTPLAWYAHQLPEWFQKLSVVGTYVIEIPIPFLFFSPIRNLKIFAFWSQVFFQVAIILTGNYNFFNLLTITLCISLLDDEDLGYRTGRHLQGLPKLLVRLISLVVYLLLIYWTVHYFSLSINWPKTSIDSKINFSESEFFSFVNRSVVAGMWLGSISLAGVILAACLRSLLFVRGVFSKVWSLLQVVIVTFLAVYMFCVSLPSLAVVDRDAYYNLAPIVHDWKSNSDFLELSNSYGLFRRMTGVGGRPEVVVEGSNNLTAGWKPYEFKYKPGDISAIPAVVTPHQPRLDWQMWFAALGSVRQNPWFVSLVYRLLTNQEEVLQLIDHNPFPKSPPKFIRAKLYHYHFTSWSQKSNNWWRRKEVDSYLDPVAKESQPIKSFVQSSGIKYKSKRQGGSFILQFLSIMRQYFGSLSGPVFIYSMFIPILILIIFR